MKVLFDHSSPFKLAHGGFQIQIEETKAALMPLGVEVEYLRWWDANQTGDLIHYFGRPVGSYIEFAHRKRIPVVITDLLTGLGSRSRPAVYAQKLSLRFIRKLLPQAAWARMGWDSYQKADRIVALTEWEANLMKKVFQADPARIVVIPNGVSSEFLQVEKESSRSEFLVCTATITERKCVYELAEAAVDAKTPLWIVGEPYGENDPYAKRFLDFVHEHSDLIRYEGGVSDRQRLAEIYRSARGFVLLSRMESLSLSALEAAACGCPLLLSDLPWARTVFHDRASYCPLTGKSVTAACLRKFYDEGPELQHPPKPLSWSEVAQQLKSVYSDALGIKPMR